MTFTEEETKEFREITLPVIKWMNEHCHPHSKVTVTQTAAIVWEGQISNYTEEFIKD